MKQPIQACRRSVVCLAVSLFTWAANTQAATSAYSDQVVFDAGLLSAGLTASGYGFPAFELVGDSSSVTAGPATFTGMNAGNAVAGFVNDSYGIAGAFYTHQLISQSDVNNVVSISFATPVRAFAFTSNVMNPPLLDPINPNNWPTAGMALLTLTTSSGDVLNLSSPLFTNYGSDPGVVVPYSFSGIIASGAFTSVTLSVAQGQNLQITQFSVAAVPEPASVALWLAGLGVLGFGVRRRTS